MLPLKRKKSINPWKDKVNLSAYFYMKKAIWKGYVL